ncbi:hypothetical protein PLUTE_a3863 [Pseudoalteromonas luteoviolacea DSM 6061]|nr:hypothetical protein [Pseudoalteromonas luteoviolacea DSM 6061]
MCFLFIIGYSVASLPPFEVNANKPNGADTERYTKQLSFS